MCYAVCFQKSASLVKRLRGLRRVSAKLNIECVLQFMSFSPHSEDLIKQLCLSLLSSKSKWRFSCTSYSFVGDGAKHSSS